MAAFIPVVGIITNIEHLNETTNPANDCTILFTLEGEYPTGAFQVQLPANAYVLNLHPFQIGDRATFFYDPNAPMVLVYPPRYTAVAGANTPRGTTAVLDRFQNHLANTDNSLKLNVAWNTPVTLANGQPYKGHLNGHLLLALYGMSTRSIPAQTTPEQIVVFCQNQ